VIRAQSLAPQLSEPAGKRIVIPQQGANPLANVLTDGLQQRGPHRWRIGERDGSTSMAARFSAGHNLELAASAAGSGLSERLHQYLRAFSRPDPRSRQLFFIRRSRAALLLACSRFLTAMARADAPLTCAWPHFASIRSNGRGRSERQ